MGRHGAAKRKSILERKKRAKWYTQKLIDSDETPVVLMNFPSDSSEKKEHHLEQTLLHFN